MEKKEMVLTGGFSLVPKTLDEAMQMAKLMADSDLVPKDYKGKPGNVLIAVQMGAELGVAPMQAIQSIAVINGKPSIYGDLGKALLQRSGCRIHIDDVELVKKNQMARCRIEREGMPPVERTFSVDDAKTARLWGKEGPWTSYPWRQMSWRAFWFAARDAASDLLKGLSGREEIEDIDPDKVIQAEIVMPRRAAPEAAATAEPAPAPATAAAPPPAPAVAPEPIEATVTIAEVKKFNDGRFDVYDQEGVIYTTKDEAVAMAARESKGKIRAIRFQPVDGKAPILVAVAPVPEKAAA